VNFIDLARYAMVQLALVSPPRRSVAISDEFYDPPQPLPPGAPGDLIRCAPMDAYVVPGVRLRVRAWRVLYHSTSATGEPTAVSGSVLVPRSSVRGPRPLVGYAVGTHGIGDSAAPSRLLGLGTEWEAGLIAMALARGWAIAITDYQGLGTPGDHTFMVGQALGHNVLDMMRAARSLAPAELPTEGPAAIIGYSEGGAAAAWAAQLQPSYAPDLPLVGVAAGAAAADIETAGPSLEGGRFSFFIAYGGIGYVRLGADVRLHVTRGGIDHLSGAIVGTPIALSWISRRLRHAGEAKSTVERSAEVVVRPFRQIGPAPVLEAAC
jgi:hypothetical protein